jgi:hypothetical protein
VHSTYLTVSFNAAVATSIFHHLVYNHPSGITADH